MKNITLLLTVFTISLNSYSQVVFDIISNSCDTNVVGTFPFEYAGELDGSSTDWGCPDITNAANAVQGCLVLVDDGSVGTTVIGSPGITLNNAVLGCDSTNWTQDLTGKIAVIFRGICGYGLKAFNAQKRGAIGVIIINHTGGAMGMAGSSFGPAVTIPVIQIGRADGDQLLACLDTTCNGVVGFIGNRLGFYQNDMGTSKGNVLLPENSATPQNIAPNGTVFPVDLGLWAYNLGTNAQNGVSASVIVTLNNSTVFNQTSLPLNFIAPMSNVIDTQFFDLGTYAPNNWLEGTYIVTYTIDNLNDEHITDNVYSYEFKITDYLIGEYSKSRTDNLLKPIHTTAYSLNQGFIYDNWEACIHYRTPVSYVPAMRFLKGLTFSCSAVGSSVANEIIEVRAYEWNDVFTDINTPPTFNSLNLLASGQYTYLDNSNNGQNIDVDFSLSPLIESDKRYLLCVFNASDSLRVGYDEGMNYTATVNNYLQPIAPVKTKGSGQADTWYLSGVGLDVTPAITVYFDFEVGVENSQHEIEIIPYPNPATNLLTVPIRKKVSGNVIVEVFDLSGKLVLSENKIIADEPLKVNVASISNGAYLFKLSFSDGTYDQFKVSVNR